MAGVVSSFSQLIVVFVHLGCWCTLFVLDSDKSASCCCKGWFVGIRFYMSKIKTYVGTATGVVDNHTYWQDGKGGRLPVRWGGLG